MQRAFFCIPSPSSSSSSSSSSMPQMGSFPVGTRTVHVPYVQTSFPMSQYGVHHSLVQPPVPPFTPHFLMHRIPQTGAASMIPNVVSVQHGGVPILQNPPRTLRLSQELIPKNGAISPSGQAIAQQRPLEVPNVPDIKLPKNLPEDPEELKKLLEMDPSKGPVNPDDPEGKWSVEEWKRFRLRAMSRLRKQRWRAKKRAEVLAGVENTKIEEQERLRKDRIRKQLQRAKKKQRLAEEQQPEQEEDQSSDQQESTELLEPAEPTTAKCA